MGPVGLQSGKTAQGKCMVTFDFTEGRSPHGPPLPEGAMPLSGLLCTCLAPSFLKGRLSKPGYSTLFPWHLPWVPATPEGRRDKPAAAEVGCRMPRGQMVCTRYIGVYGCPCTSQFGTFAPAGSEGPCSLLPFNDFQGWKAGSCPSICYLFPAAQ